MTLAGRRVAVTGASGFIGRALLAALDARGARPIAVVRTPAKIAREGLEARKADLSDLEALTAALEGCDALVANAALVSLGAESREALTRANVEGTRNVIEAARRAGVRRVVLTSSTAAYARRAGRIYEEDDPLWPDDARVARPLYYAVSKATAEREAWALCDRHRIDLSVARPSGVYGPHDHSGLTPWLDRLSRIPLLTAFPAGLHVPMVYVADLADAMVRMLERPIASGRAYNVTGDPEVSFRQMFDAYRAARRRGPQLVLPIPVPLRYAYSNARAERELGFTNRPPLAAFTDMFAR